MSRLSKLTGQTKTYVIGGVELQFKARTLKDLDLIMDLGDETKRTEAMRKLIKVTIQEAEPEATEQELENFGLQYLQELTAAVVDVNGLKNVAISN